MEPVKMEVAEEGELSIAAIAQLIDNLKHSDVEIRLRSVKHVGDIATALGPLRTREELLPFLLDTVDDEEQVQALLAQELKGFVPLIGGAEYVTSMVNILEALVSVEDATVREKAIETINAVAAVASPESIAQFVAMFRRLSEARWFSQRSAAASIAVGLYRRATPDLQIELITKFAQMGHDETPMVRRAVAAMLKDFAECASEDVIEKQLVPLLQECSQDDQDSVRLLVAAASATMVQRCAAKGDITPIFATFQRIAEDPSWRVRYMVAENITEFTAIGASDPNQARLLQVFVGLLGDAEAEVRCVCAGKVFIFCNALPAATRSTAITSDVIPRLEELSRDSSEHVRTALASVIMSLSSIVGKVRTIQQLLPLFLLLLKDECSDVRLNIISHLEDVNRVIGIGQLSQALLPAIQELASNRLWRVRLAIVENIPLVAKQLGDEFFNTNLLPLCIQWLQDAIYAVRRAATDNLRIIAQGFGPEWIKRQLLPLIIQLTNSDNFVHRLTSVFCLNSLLDICDADTLKSVVLSVLLRLARDKIPNIRLNVTQTLFKFCSLVDRQVVESVVQALLVELSVDPDRDVAFTALCAVQDLNLVR